MIATQDRCEYKFLLPAGQGEEFRKFIADQIPVDRGAEEGYPVLSEYFDTPDRHSYWQKIWGSRNRRRVRTRVYGRSDGRIPPAGFVEIKHKHEVVGVKRRAALSLAAIHELAQGRIPADLLLPERSRSDAHVLGELRDLIIDNGARPVVQSRYDRMAYDSGPLGTIRVTFDTQLRCRFLLKPLIPDDPDFPLPIVDRDVAVVEVKTFGPVPPWLRAVTGRFGLNPVSMSKYCLSLERYDPAVARNPMLLPLSPITTRHPPTRIPLNPWTISSP